jgi:HK97 family phage portal protein
MVLFQPRGTTLSETITTTDARAGGLVVATNLFDYRAAATDPAQVWAKYDAARTVETFIANAIATVPFDLYRKTADGSREKVSAEDHIIAAMLEMPLAGQGAARWIQAVMLDFRIHDRWAAVKLIDPETGALELARLPAQRTTFLLDQFRRVTAASISNGTDKPLDIPIEHIVYDVGYDPYQTAKRTRGFAISNTMETATNELERGAQYRADLLSNGPKVPMYISRPLGTKWEKGAKALFTEQFREYSTVRAGQTPILDDGMELKAAPQLLSGDVNYKEMRLAAQVEYAIANHVAPELLGYRQGTFSNIDALKEQLYTQTLQLDIVALRQALNVGLRGDLGGGYYIEENIAARLASSPEKQAATLSTQVGAPVRTRNEARRMLNLPPVPGGDELITPLNVTTGGLASPRDTGAKSIVLYPREAKALEKAAVTDAISAHTKKLAEQIRSFIAEQRDRVMSVLGAASSPGPLGDGFDKGLEDDLLAEHLLRSSYAIATEAADRVNATWNLGAEGFDPEVMLPWLRKASLSTAAVINDTTYAKAATAIFGEDWHDAILNVFDERMGVSDRHAESAAKAAASFGQEDAARAAGVPLKRWNTSSKHSRHASVGGEVVPVGETFSNGARYPGDPKLPADERIGCACSIEYLKEKP